MIGFYDERMDYIDYKRTCLEYKYQGISFFNPKYENNSEVMISFYFDKMSKFEEEFDRIEKNDTSECIQLRKMKAKW